MHFELRILNGLHRGAALPLDGTALDIGSGEQAAVVLADPGVAARHASLTATDTGWLLEALEGEIVGVDDPRPQTVLELAPGGHARLGEVWLCVSPVDAAWQAPPAPIGRVDDVPVPVPPMAGQAEPDAPPPVRRSRLRRVLLPVGALAVLSAATACAIAVRAPVATPLVSTVPVLERGAALPVAQPALGAAQLQAAFRHALAEAQLLDSFDLALGERSWSLRADLDVDEQARFERLLKKFVTQHGLTIPIDAKIVGAAAMLPFEIAQVVSGRRAGIVTADGARLYVGDDYRGVRLVSVKDRQLVFAGKRKIEVSW